MKTLASPANYGIYVPQIAGSSIGEGSMKKATIGTIVPLEKCPFRAFPSRPALYAGRLLTGPQVLRKPRFVSGVEQHISKYNN